MVISRRVAWFLVAFGAWSWVIWPTFLKNIWADKRSWNDGMTAFFGVHLVLTVVSLTLGTIIGVLGIRALRARPTSTGTVEADRSVAGETLTITVAGREVAELSPVRRHRWVSGPALLRVWRGPAPCDLERDIAVIDASVIDPYDA